MQWARLLHWQPFVQSICWACDHLSVLGQWELGHVLVAEALVFGDASHFCEPMLKHLGAQMLTLCSIPTAGQKTRYGHREFWCDAVDACTKQLGLTT